MENDDLPVQDRGFRQTTMQGQQFGKLIVQQFIALVDQFRMIRAIGQAAGTVPFDFIEIVLAVKRFLAAADQHWGIAVLIKQIAHDKLFPVRLRVVLTLAAPAVVCFRLWLRASIRSTA